MCRCRRARAAVRGVVSAVSCRLVCENETHVQTKKRSQIPQEAGSKPMKTRLVSFRAFARGEILQVCVCDRWSVDSPRARSWPAAWRGARARHERSPAGRTAPGAGPPRARATRGATRHADRRARHATRPPNGTPRGRRRRDTARPHRHPIAPTRRACFVGKAYLRSTVWPVAPQSPRTAHILVPPSPREPSMLARANFMDADGVNSWCSRSLPSKTSIAPMMACTWQSGCS